MKATGSKTLQQSGAAQMHASPNKRSTMGSSIKKSVPTPVVQPEDNWDLTGNPTVYLD